MPVTIETGSADANVNFYDPAGRFEYGVGYDMEGLELASVVGDCRKVEQKTDEPYRGCGHAILEIWSGQEDVISGLLEKNAVERPSYIGVIGEEGWLIPKYTGDKDSSLLSYFGLMGEENREKLADRFLRPTSWQDYCNEVSNSSCVGGLDDAASLGQMPVDVALRATVEDDHPQRRIGVAAIAERFHRPAANDGTQAARHQEQGAELAAGLCPAQVKGADQELRVPGHGAVTQHAQ